MNPERGEFLNAEDWCLKCWQEFTRLSDDEQAIWDFLAKRQEMLLKKQEKKRERPLILCENDGTLYQSVHEAASVYKMTPAGVYSILRGIPNKKKGLVFSYYRK